MKTKTPNNLAPPPRKKVLPEAQMTYTKAQGRTIKTSEGEGCGLAELKKLQEGSLGGSVC